MTVMPPLTFYEYLLGVCATFYGVATSSAWSLFGWGIPTLAYVGILYMFLQKIAAWALGALALMLLWTYASFQFSRDMQIRYEDAFREVNRSSEAKIAGLTARIAGLEAERERARRAMSAAERRRLAIRDTALQQLIALLDEGN